MTNSGPLTPPRAALAASWWAVTFTALHVYWFAGGRVGFGDQTDPLPGWPTSVTGWIGEVVLITMFVAGIVVPIAMVRPWGAVLPRRVLVVMMWIGCVVLLLRGASGIADDILRFGGLVSDGLTGLSTREVLGSAHPTTYTKLSTVAIDVIFVSGGLIFGLAARLGRAARGPSVM
jgi:hypothetical protein